MQNLQEILAGARKLAALRGSALRLTSIFSGEDWDMGEIVHTIEHDQALTGRVLQLANSATSGARVAVDSVRAAVMRVGTGPVVSLAVSTTVNTAMAQPLGVLEEEDGALWRHSVASALAVQLAGGFCDAKPPPECFIAALLHDVGFLALDHWLTEMPDDLRETARASIQEADHAVLAGLIAGQWGLSEAVQEGLTFHHVPEEAPTVEGRRIADFVMLADCAAVAAGERFGAEEVRLDRRTTELLGIDRERFAALSQSTRNHLGGFLELYGA